MSKPLLKAFAIGIKPEGKFDIVQWAKKNVNLPNSDKSATADLNLTPWLITPLQDIIDRKYDHYNFVAATGCHSKGTKILTYSGDWVNVEDVKVDDLLMGPDSTPRKVLRLCRGQDLMYKITPTKGKPFVVNQDHILSLVRTNGGNNSIKDGSITNLSVKEWLGKSKTFKHIHKLYRPEVINFDCEEVDNPYLVGAILGDGTIAKNRIILHTADYEMAQWFIDHCEDVGDTHKMYVRDTTSATPLSSFSINSGTLKNTPTSTYKVFECNGLIGTTCNDKFIPHKYKTASYQDRLELIAGLLDTDGSLLNSGFDFISKSKQLSEDLQFVCRSVGLAAYVAESKKKSQYGTEGTYYRVSISGNTDIIPTKIPRKQATTRLQKKSVLRTGFTVKEIGNDDYYGFQVDKDNLYVMEDFFVTHNSGKSTLIEILTTYLILERPSQVGIFSQTQAAAQVWMESRLLPSLKKNPRVVELLPSNRHDIKKDAILFGHMNLFVRGSSIANTQSLSLDAAISDESWIAPQDALSYILRRKHDRAFSWSLFVSQAGLTNSEFYEQVKDTITMEYHYKCPKCGGYHPFRFISLVIFDGQNFDNVYYKCAGCGERLNDDPQTRRYMSQNGKYMELDTNKNHVLNPTNKKNITYVFNAGLNHMVPWSSLAREFYKANEKAKKYDYEPLKVFKTQRLSEWWNMEDIEFVQVEKSGYSLEDKEKSDITLMAVDVQGQIGDNSFWYAVRTFSKDTGESKLLDFGRFASYDDIPRKQEEWNLRGNCVALDCAYKTDEVREFAAHYGYLTLNGVQANVFPVNVKGKAVNRIYGLIRKEKTLKGQYASYAPYSSTRAKVVCAGLRSSQQWKIPNDIPEHYMKQLNAEIYQEGKWKQVNPQNHAIDVDAMLLILALVHGVHIDVETQEEIKDSEG